MGVTGSEGCAVASKDEECAGEGQDEHQSDGDTQHDPSPSGCAQRSLRESVVGAISPEGFMTLV